MRAHKRKTFKNFCLVLSVILLMFSGCSCNENKTPPTITASAKVTFLDVGQGDCFIINLPDAKTAIIDTGDIGYNNYDKIDAILQNNNVSKIDYLFITHPDFDHIGNAYSLIEEYQVGKVYLPYVYQDVVQGVFPELERVEQLISTKNIEFEYNAFLHTVKGDGYHFTFLSPEEKSMPNGVYFNFDPLSPSETQVNNISSVVYLDCLGVRFAFMGDVSKSVERKIVDRYLGTNIYQQYANSQGYNIELSNVDFLKIAHHGASQSTSVELVNFLNPTNAVISVGALNPFGYPSTEALTTLLENGINLLRTDVKGNVVVAIQRDGSYQITTKIG